MVSLVSSQGVVSTTPPTVVAGSSMDCSCTGTKGTASDVNNEDAQPSPYPLRSSMGARGLVIVQGTVNMYFGKTSNQQYARTCTIVQSARSENAVRNENRHP